ncbi:MAG: NADPH-dependent F420 reductase, partial [Woeseiaceae bacterium]
MSSSLRIACAIFSLLIVPTAALAERIAVIGTGSVGSALGPEFAAQGHDIVYGSREPSRDGVQALVARTSGNASATTADNAVIDADIIVLAVPGRLAAQIAADLGDLSGKIIIDPTNHYERNADGIPVMLTLPSNAQAIQAAAPGSMVVKAFNTLNWQQMVDPDSSGGPVSIPLVGDSAV